MANSVLRGEQMKQLPVTTSSYIVDNRGTEAYFIFVVLVIGVTMNQLLTLSPVPDDMQFPLAIAFTVLVYFGFKKYLNGKPPKFLTHLLIYPTIPKKYTHQFRAKSSLFIDEQS
jgi:hypothetical protein